MHAGVWTRRCVRRGIAAELSSELMRMTCVALAPPCSTAAATARSCLKGPVDLDLLPHDRLPIHVVNRTLGLLLAHELDKRVALDEAGSTVQVEVHVFDVAKVAKLVVDVVLLRLLVQSRDEDNPTLD